MAPATLSPEWPLAQVTPKFSLTSFGGGRPANCINCERWHAGVDLTSAPDGSLVVAPVAGVVAGVDKGWSGAAKALYLRTPDGLFVVLGGVKLGSSGEFGVQLGQQVSRGQPIGRVLGSYGMIHLETYADPNKSRTGNSPWYVGNKAPSGLLNPTWFVQSMVGQPPAFLTSKQKLSALADLGWYQGPLDTWGPTATAALKKAQAAYGLDADGIWGPMTDAAIHEALGADWVPPVPAPGPAPAPGPNPAPPSSGSNAGAFGLAALVLAALWWGSR